MSERHGVVFWASAAAGWALIAWGIRGALIHHLDTKPPDLARFFLAGLLLHDLVFAPLVLVGGVALGRLSKGRWRAPAQVLLIVGGCAALFAWPLVRDYAGVHHNPSSLPHNYTANLLVVLAALAAVVCGVTLLRVQRVQRGQRGERRERRERGRRRKAGI